jgi:hypothetical protein
MEYTPLDRSLEIENQTSASRPIETSPVTNYYMQDVRQDPEISYQNSNASELEGNSTPGA